MKRSLITVSTLALLSKATAVFAATNSGTADPIVLPDPLSGATIPSVISNVFDFLVQLAAVVAPILIVVGAFQMITAAGSTESFNKGKHTILYTAIGFVIILMARGIVDIVKSIIGG